MIADRLSPPSLSHPAVRVALRTRLLRLGIVFVTAVLVAALYLLGHFSLRAANNLLHPYRAPMVQTPADLGAPYEPAAFPSRDGTPLRGWFIPGHNGAGIVAIHGLWGNREHMLDQAAWLWRRGGYSVVLFDLRATGESGGDTVTFGHLESGDALGAADFLRSRPEVRDGRIGALGQSLGAATAVLAGARSHDLRAIVADSSFTSVDSMIATSFQRVTGLPPFPFASLVTWISEQQTGLRPGEIAPLAAVGRVSPTPLLLIHGGSDTLIPPASARALYAAAGEPKDLWAPEGAEHVGAQFAAPEEYQRRVLEFFERWLAPPG